jgi:hypothetical protein
MNECINGALQWSITRMPSTPRFPYELMSKFINGLMNYWSINGGARPGDLEMAPAAASVDAGHSKRGSICTFCTSKATFVLVKHPRDLEMAPAAASVGAGHSKRGHTRVQKAFYFRVLLSVRPVHRLLATIKKKKAAHIEYRVV